MQDVTSKRIVNLPNVDNNYKPAEKLFLKIAYAKSLSQTFPDYSNDEDLCRNLKYFLQQLPPLNYGLLRFLCRFLASVASFQQESWNVGALAAVFGPDIFQ